MQRGTSNVSFSWQIVAGRADTRDSCGRVFSKHVGLRLSVAPGSIKNRALPLDNNEEAPATKEIRDTPQS